MSHCISIAGTVYATTAKYSEIKIQRLSGMRHLVKFIILRSYAKET